MINLSPEKIQQFLAERKTATTQREAETTEIEQFLAAEKATRQAYFASKKQKVCTTRVAHVCHDCGTDVPVHSRVVYRNVDVLGGKEGQIDHFETWYFCVNCHPFKEAQ